MLKPQPQDKTYSEQQHPDAAKYHSKRVVSESQLLIDFGILLISAFLAKWLYLDFLGHGMGDPVLLPIATVVGSILGCILLKQGRLYEFKRLSAFRGCQMFNIALRVAITALVLTGIGFILKISAEISRGWVLSWIGLSILGLWAAHFLTSRLILRWSRLGYFTRNIAIYGSSELAMRLTQHLGQKFPDVRVKGIFDDRLLSKRAAIPTLGSLSDLIRLGQTERLDEVIIALPSSSTDRISSLVKELSILPVDISVCPDAVAFQLNPKRLVHEYGVTLLEVATMPLGDWAPIIKAIEDRILGSLCLILAAPLMLFISLLIKLDSKGPVLFKQRRHGFNHQVFWVMKFRTMYVAEDGADIKQASRDDVRVTRVGRFLRRTSLDELPQLLNVIKGEMSLVGPRPHALAHNEYYSAHLESYANRHKMKPGITGWAQINGFRGETETPSKMKSRVEYDLYYIDNWSLFFDLKIFLVTPIYGLIHKNAF